MKRLFRDAIAHRRSYYAISDKSPVSDIEIENIINFAVKNVPSAYNSQSTRIVLLLGDNHKQLWSIVKETLRKIVPSEAFPSTHKKIESFAAGYGSILYFEDQAVIKAFQEDFPLYADNFPVWSQHTSAMHQFTIWTMLEDIGFGASLQHYNPLIDYQVHDLWQLPLTWKLIAQMPFGVPTVLPENKTFQPLSDRVLVFK